MKLRAGFELTCPEREPGDFFWTCRRKYGSRDWRCMVDGWACGDCPRVRPTGETCTKCGEDRFTLDGEPTECGLC